MSHKPITIVGGGLAGLALGVFLRQRDIPVQLLESGIYPRHRVCGEFISGDGWEVLQELGVEEEVKAGGARSAETCAFYMGQKKVLERKLPARAWSISRHALDDLLAGAFTDAGGELRTRTRYSDSFEIPGVIRATGRRPQPTAAGWRWIGLKIHATDLALESDLEMHFTRSGYLGLCRVENGEVNICGLMRTRDAISDLAETWLTRFIGGDENLEARLRRATLEKSSFCSVAGLAVGLQRSFPGELPIGDAFAVIPPLTGNGMSLALESARLATAPLVDYAEGRSDWSAAVATAHRLLHDRFASRVRTAVHLQTLLMVRPWSTLALGAGQLFPPLWNLGFAKTR